jgi:uncharacterized caspase-like protein
MGRFCTFAVWVMIGCICMLGAHARAAPQRRTALVIGNAAYGEIGVLANPVNDASDMAALLQQLGFAVTLLRDVDLRFMREAVDAFSRQLRQGGVGLFYFAGHGVQVSGENYLIPLRANIAREQDVPYEALPVGRILGGMEDADNQLNIVILDACRHNPYARQWRSSQRGLAPVQAARGALIAYATAPGSTAADGGGRNGFYTSYLLQYMPTPGISVEHLFKQVRAEVVRATRGKQMPWESSSLIGDFTFALQPLSPPPAMANPAAPPALAAPVPMGPDPEAAAWAVIEKSNNSEDLRAFLKEYPQGRFAPAARLRLQQQQRLAAQQRAEEQQRLAEQERQRREREAAEAPQRVKAQHQEEERRRLEAAKQREETQPAIKGPEAPRPSQVTRLEPETKQREHASVAVPAATLSGQSSAAMGWQPWSKKVSAFHIDRQPISNKEFLDFVKAAPQWKKSQIDKNFHDGDYLKHWASDETVNSKELDRPVRYVSYFAAEAYCNAQGKKVPQLDHYRIASGFKESPTMDIVYDIQYQTRELHFMQAEWTNSWWGLGTPDSGKRLKYWYRSAHSNDPKSRDYAPEEDKRYTGRSLGFRCIKY